MRNTQEIILKYKGHLNQLPKYKKQPTMSGVYFLIKDNRVVYVGKAVKIATRVHSHTRFEWDSYTFIEILDEYDRQDVERSFIKLLCPEYNTSCKTYPSDVIDLIFKKQQTKSPYLKFKLQKEIDNILQSKTNIDNI